MSCDPIFLVNIFYYRHSLCLTLFGGREEDCPCYISETIRCRKLIFGRDIGWGCRCAALWCNLDLTFNLAVMTLTYKILSGLYIG